MFLKYGYPIRTQRNAVHTLICLNLWGKLTFFFLPVPWPQRKKQQSCGEVYCAGATSKHLSNSHCDIRDKPQGRLAQGTAEWHPRWSPFLWGIPGCHLGVCPSLAWDFRGTSDFAMTGHQRLELIVELCTLEVQQKTSLVIGISDWYTQYLTIYLFSNESIKKQLPILNDPVC